MKHLVHTAIAAAVLSASVCTSALAQNITQNQTGWSNSQSISIGNTDAKPAKAKKVKEGKEGKEGKAISSAQNDPDTGNSQSANVSGSAKVKQSQEGRSNKQSADVDSSGNISQNQSGRNNSQSISIGSGVSIGGSSSGTPSLTQSQTGVNKKQSIKIDGKKVETKE